MSSRVTFVDANSILSQVNKHNLGLRKGQADSVELKLNYIHWRSVYTGRITLIHD